VGLPDLPSSSVPGKCGGGSANHCSARLSPFDVIDTNVPDVRQLYRLGLSFDPLAYTPIQ
jgi:hypothetical protein